MVTEIRRPMWAALKEGVQNQENLSAEPHELREQNIVTFTGSWVSFFSRSNHSQQDVDVMGSKDQPCFN